MDVEQRIMKLTVIVSHENIGLRVPFLTIAKERNCSQSGSLKQENWWRVSLYNCSKKYHILSVDAKLEKIGVSLGYQLKKLNCISIFKISIDTRIYCFWYVTDGLRFASNLSVRSSDIICKNYYFDSITCYLKTVHSFALTSADRVASDFSPWSL
jgi:hypothetical protein